MLGPYSQTFADIEQEVTYKSHNETPLKLSHI